jgi:hypothetical protein
MIESVLFTSPYSGCRSFSGWPAAPCQQAPGNAWPPQRNAPGAILCVDRYKKTLRPMQKPLPPKYGPPRATVTCATPTQNGRFTIRGPSTAGPWTRYAGWDEKGTDEFESGGMGAGGHNHGLT